MESIKNKMVLTGISFGASICGIENLLEITERQFDIIEIPLGESVYFDNVVGFAKERGMDISLHIPSMEMVECFPFILDTQTNEQINQYVEYVSYFLDEHIKKMDLKPVYIVMHFPLISKRKDVIGRRELNKYFLNKMSSSIKRYDIPLLIENVAVDNAFFQGKDYKSVLSKVDGICFDIGHSYTSGYILGVSVDIDLVDDMFTELSDYIQCIHLYNTVQVPSNGYSPRLHYPFGIAANGRSRFMNEELIMERMEKLPNLKYIIYEPHRKQVLEYGDFGSLRHMVLEE